MSVQTIARTTQPSGLLSLRKIGTATRDVGYSLWQVVRRGLPITGVKEVDRYRWRNLPNLWRGFWKITIAHTLRIPHFYGAVYMKVLRSNGDVVDLGLVSMRVVTTVGVNFVVDAFQNSVEVENLKYHGFGTGGAAEGVGNTALTTELTTEYATNDTRPTGTTTEGASANIYRTVATLTPDAAVAITEHGIFDQASNAGGVLWDRSLFSAVNLNGTGDALQATYDGTFAAGS